MNYTREVEYMYICGHEFDISNNGHDGW